MPEGSSQLWDGSNDRTCRASHEGAVLLQPLPFSREPSSPKTKADSLHQKQQRPRLTEGVKDLDEGTQSNHTLAWRPPPHPSISSNLPLPSAFPITILVTPFLTPGKSRA